MLAGRRISMLTRALAAVGAACVAGLPAVGHAELEPAPVSLAWSAPAECVSATELRRSVAAMLGRPVWAAPEDAHVVLDGSLVEEGEEWVLRLTLRDATRVLGTREARKPGEGCRSLDRTIVVIIALLVDLPRTDIVLLVPPDTQVDLPTTTRTADRTRRGPTVDARSDGRAAESSVEVRLGVHAWLDVGTLPLPAFGGRLALGIAPAQGWPVLRLSGGALAPSETELDESGRGARVWLAGGAIDVCPEAFLGPFVLGACAGVALDALVGSGIGLVARQAVGARWSVRAAGTAAVRVGVVDIGVELGIAATVARDSFVRDGETAAPAVLYEPSWVSFSATFGVTTRFGS